MPFSHFRGTGSGGFTPPLATGSAEFIRQVASTGTGGSTAPVDGLRRGRWRKPFRMRRYEKCACNSHGIRSYKNKGLKLPWNQQLQKKPGGPPLPATAVTCKRSR